MWGLVEISPESLKTLHFDLVDIHIQRQDDEWLFAHTRHVADTDDIVEPVETDWLRLISAFNESLELSPVLPDRPLVIRPESPVSILPGRFARFFVAVPVWFRFVSVTDKKKNDVIDIPSRILSNTWFGNPADGELCYSLDAPLKRTADQLGDLESVVTCGLVVRNASQEKLNFERICVHVENLAVFEHEGRLWTNEILVVFKGSDQVSQISIQTGPPEEIVGAERMTEPREAPNRNILRRSFSLIRYVAGI